MPEEQRPCANPDCECEAPGGSDYCSDYCQDPHLADMLDYDLPLERGASAVCCCEHVECGGNEEAKAALVDESRMKWDA